MNKKLLIISTVTIIAVIGFVVSKSSQKSIESEPKMKNGAMMQKSDISVDNDKMMEGTTVDSRYVEYSKSALDSASKNRRVLFFYASWCPTCRPADASFSQNMSKIPENVTVIRVNYNDQATDQEEKQLAKKYGITYQHTFVQIDGSGEEITKWNGGQLNELLSNIK